VTLKLKIFIKFFVSECGEINNQLQLQKLKIFDNEWKKKVQNS